MFQQKQVAKTTNNQRNVKQKNNKRHTCGGVKLPEQKKNVKKYKFQHFDFYNMLGKKYLFL